MEICTSKLPMVKSLWQENALFVLCHVVTFSWVEPLLSYGNIVSCSGSQHYAYQWIHTHNTLPISQELYWLSYVHVSPKHLVRPLQSIIYACLPVKHVLFVCLFVLMLYVPVNNFSVMSGHVPVFLGWACSWQRIKCLAQGHNTVPLVSLEPATLRSQV